MDASLLNWLSSSENPAVRHLTALHLKPPSSIRTMKSLRRQMLKWEPWARILALQQEDGSFPSLDGKRTAAPTFVALCLADRCGMDVSDAKRLKQLEDENRRLKKLLADTMLDKQVLQDIVEKKL